MGKEAPTTATKSAKIRCTAEVAKYTIFPNSSYFMFFSAETWGANLHQTPLELNHMLSAKACACMMLVVWGPCFWGDEAKDQH